MFTYSYDTMSHIIDGIK